MCVTVCVHYCVTVCVCDPTGLPNEPKSGIGFFFFVLVVWISLSSRVIKEEKEEIEKESKGLLAGWRRTPE